jgi:ATP-binding cassette subfamily G (WHITE) protein 2 (PDR)
MATPSSAHSDATAKEQGAIVGSVPKTPVHDDTTETFNEKNSESPSRTLEADEDEPYVDESKEMQRRASVVQALARSYSRASGAAGDNPFLAGPDSPLNPASENFSGKEWAKAIVGLVSQDGGSFRSAGVCFQNLNVHGFGESTDYQKDIANVWLSLAGWAGSLISSNKQRIDILRRFDGIVRKGEMLVVLGPPGSGCSTFLKTIAGEMNGIYVDDDSYFNYQGKYFFSSLVVVKGCGRNL